MIRAYGSMFVNSLSRAFADGFMDSLRDASGAHAAAATLGIPELEAVFIEHTASGEAKLRALLEIADAPIVKVSLASVLGGRGATTEALALIAAAQMQEEFALLWYVRGRVCAKSQRWGEAAAALERAAESAPDRPKSWRDLARVRLELGLVDEAMEAFEHAVALDRSLLAHYGNALLKAERVAEAEPILREAATQSPQDTEIARLLAQALLALKRPAEALVVLQSAANQRDVRVWQQMIECLLAQDRLDEVMKLVRSAVGQSDLLLVEQLWCAAMFYALQLDDDGFRSLSESLRQLASQADEYRYMKFLVHVFGLAVQSGQARRVRQAIEMEELEDFVRPAYEALRVLENDRRRRQLAPEVRNPTLEILTRWVSEGRVNELETKQIKRTNRRKRT
jgi:predicted Zn-dependent protease